MAVCRRKSPRTSDFGVYVKAPGALVSAPDVLRELSERGLPAALCSVEGTLAAARAGRAMGEAKGARPVSRGPVGAGGALAGRARAAFGIWARDARVRCARALAEADYYREHFSLIRDSSVLPIVHKLLINRL